MGNEFLTDIFSDIEVIQQELSKTVDTKFQELSEAELTLQRQAKAAMALEREDLTAKIAGYLSALEEKRQAIKSILEENGAEPMLPASPEPEPASVAASNDSTETESAPEDGKKKRMPPFGKPEFDRRLAAWVDAVNVLLGKDVLEGESMSEAKSAVCTGRALLEAAADLEENTEDMLTNFETLSHHLAKFNEGFFAFDLDLHRGYAAWSHLADAYRLLAVAESTAAWYPDKAQFASDEDWWEVYSRCAAAESLVVRELEYFGLDFVDEQQAALHQVLVKMLPQGKKVRWWKLKGAEMPMIEEIRTEARGLPARERILRDMCNKLSELAARKKAA